MPIRTNLVLVQGDAQRGVDGQDQVLIALPPWNRQPKAGPVHCPALQTITLPSLLPTSAPQLPSLPARSLPSAQSLLPQCTVLSPLPPVPLPSGSPPGFLPTSPGSQSQSRAGGRSIPFHCLFYLLPLGAAFQALSTLGKALASQTRGALVPVSAVAPRRHSDRPPPPTLARQRELPTSGRWQGSLLSTHVALHLCGASGQRTVTGGANDKLAGAPGAPRKRPTSIHPTDLTKAREPLQREKRPFQQMPPERLHIHSPKHRPKFHTLYKKATQNGDLNFK